MLNDTAEGKHLVIASELASEAWDQICDLYHVPTGAKVVPLGIDTNRVYHISIPGRVEQVLRLSPPSARTKHLVSALAVLEYLSETTDLRVPSPIPDKHGRLLATIREGGKRGPTRASMFSYVSGEVLSETELSSDIMFRIGQTLGRLHMALQSADEAIKPSPSRWSRHPRDGATVVGWWLARLSKRHGDSDFLPEHRLGIALHPTLLEIGDRLRKRYRQLERFLPHQLLHGDAHLRNLVFDGTSVGILDFELVCYGPRIYELSVPYVDAYRHQVDSLSTHSGSLPEQVEALLAGYGSHIQLSELELNCFSFMQACRYSHAWHGWFIDKICLVGKDGCSRAVQQQQTRFWLC